MSKYDRDLYLWYKKMGICTLCRKERASQGRTRCEDCLAKEAERMMSARDAMTPNERSEEIRKNNTNAIKRMKARAESGLCAFCGKPYSQATPFGQCPDCRRKRRARARERKEENGYIERSERPSYGMCYRCGSPIDGGSLCEKCIDATRGFDHSAWRKAAKKEIDRCFSL